MKGEYKNNSYKPICRYAAGVDWSEAVIAAQADQLSSQQATGI